MSKPKQHIPKDKELDKEVRESGFVDINPETIEERVVFINRCAKVVKGGRHFSFNAIVVVGNKDGLVGYGLGKSNEVAGAIKKAVDRAKKNMQEVPIKGTTVPHQVVGSYASGRVLLKPAGPGTGVIAGGGVRAVLELAGYKDVLTKNLKSHNPINVVKATVEGLLQIKKIITTRDIMETEDDNIT